MKSSVCTLAHGRDSHLENLVLGLRQSTRPPGELVIGVMQDRRYDLPQTSFPIRQVMLGGGGIPLAAARNAAARAARGEVLVFLDVDCIPHPDLVGDYLHQADRRNGVLMGEVGYLPRGAAAKGIDYDRFDDVAVKHSERAGPPTQEARRCGDYRCFWSLNFAMRAADFDRSGGFDESFSGYGGEDTDFGRTCATRKLPIWWVRGARAYHQYHPHHMPPVHHLDSVIANAQRFEAKWGEPTMQHWLRAFTLMGLVRRTPGGWTKLREPGDAELALTRQQEDRPYASSALVLERLEAAAAARLAEGAAA